MDGLIPELIEGDYTSVLMTLAIIASLWLCVIAASIVDLITGIKASKRIGNFKTTSTGLRKTLTKDLSYLAILWCCLLMDFCLSYLSIYIPFFTLPICSLGGVVAEIAIEMISVNENIHKGRKEDNIADVVKLAAELVKTSTDNENVKNAIQVLQNAVEESKGRGSRKGKRGKKGGSDED